VPLVRVNNITVSLDGYVAGPDQSQEHPLGVGGERLHEWMVATKAFREAHDMEGGETGPDNDFAARGAQGYGAEIMGRNKFGPIRGPWPDDAWRGWWGDNPPFHTPVFVLTHHPRDPIVMEGGTTFHFVSEGIESALEQARDAAGDLDVTIGGGALTIREYLAADLIDQMHLAVVPLLLGRGERLFEGLDLADRFRFEPVHSSSAVAHFELRRR
jgi:dihydrofolate reductase